jgi:hypothetical protein
MYTLSISIFVLYSRQGAVQSITAAMFNSGPIHFSMLNPDRGEIKVISPIECCCKCIESDLCVTINYRRISKMCQMSSFESRVLEVVQDADESHLYSRCKLSVRNGLIIQGVRSETLTIVFRLLLFIVSRDMYLTWFVHSLSSNLGKGWTFTTGPSRPTWGTTSLRNCAPLPEVHPGLSGVLRRFETALLYPRSIQAYQGYYVVSKLRSFTTGPSRPTWSTTSLRNCASLPQVHPGLAPFPQVHPGLPAVLRRFETALLYPRSIQAYLGYYVASKLCFFTTGPSRPTWGTTSLWNCASLPQVHPGLPGVLHRFETAVIYPRPNPKDIISERLLSSYALPPPPPATYYWYWIFYLEGVSSYNGRGRGRIDRVYRGSPLLHGTPAGMQGRGCLQLGVFADGQFYLSHIGGCAPDLFGHVHCLTVVSERIS